MKKILLQTTVIFALSILFSCKGNESQSQGNSNDTTKSDVAAPGDNAKSKTVYVCPMHPEEKSDKPAQCSICGMDMELQS